MRKYRKTSNRNRCPLCKAKVLFVDYKDTNTLSRYLNRWNKIESSGRSGLCAKHQRQVSKAIKQARQLALLSYRV